MNTKSIRSVPLAFQVSLAGVSICMRVSKAAYRLLAINISLAFCMGTDLEYVVTSPIGQPMAQIFFNSFGQKGTLVLWAIVVLVQSVNSSTIWAMVDCAQIYDGLEHGACCIPPVIRVCTRWRAAVLILLVPHEQLHQDAGQHGMVRGRLCDLPRLVILRGRASYQRHLLHLGNGAVHRVRHPHHSTVRVQERFQAWPV